MPAVDYERAMVKLRAHISTKSAHGRDELLRQVARIEHECLIPEDQEGYDDRPVYRSFASDDGAASHEHELVRDA